MIQINFLHLWPFCYSKWCSGWKWSLTITSNKKESCAVCLCLCQCMLLMPVCNALNRRCLLSREKWLFFPCDAKHVFTSTQIRAVFIYGSETNAHIVPSGGSVVEARLVLGVLHCKCNIMTLIVLMCLFNFLESSLSSNPVNPSTPAMYKYRPSFGTMPKVHYHATGEKVRIIIHINKLIYIYICLKTNGVEPLSTQSSIMSI